MPFPIIGKFKEKRKIISKMIMALTLLVVPMIIAAWVVFDLSRIDSTQAALGINQQITYQGKLARSTGVSVSTGDYGFQFELYDASTGGSKLWSETWTATTTAGAVSVSRGIFSANLGTSTSLSTVDFNSDSLYLQVYFDSDNNGSFEETFTPRKRITSSPYAFNTDTVDGFHATSTATAGQLLALDSSKGMSLNSVTTTDSFYGGGYASTTLGFYTMGSAHFGTNLTVDGNATSSGWFNVGVTDVASLLGSNIGAGDLYVSRNATTSGNLTVGGWASSTALYVGINGQTSTSTNIRGGLLVDSNTLVVNANENKVGIGTTNPFSKLHVYNADTSDGANTRLRIENAGGGKFDLIAYGATNTSQPHLQGNAYLNATAGNLLIMANNPTGRIELYSGGELPEYERVRITATGNVGIGLTSPTSTLDVLGTFHVSGNATTSGWLNIGTTDLGAFSRNAGVGDLFVGRNSTTTGSLYVGGDINTPATVYSGVDDTSVGNLVAYGDSGANGGKIRFYYGADRDTTYQYWSMQTGQEVSGDRLWMGTSSNGSLFIFTAAGDLLLNGYASSTTGLFTQGSGHYGGTLSVDGDASFITLNSNGTVYSNNNILTNINPSSQQYKDNIQPANLDAMRILQLQPKSFTWKNNGKQDFGYIAEEIKNIIPELYQNDGQFVGYDVAKLPFYIIDVLKVQQDQINSLTADLKNNIDQPTLSVIDNSNSDMQTLSVRQAATFYGTITVLGEAGFEYKVVFEKDIEVKGKIYASPDQAGTATIKAGATSTEVTFGGEYEVVPKITATAKQPVALGITDQSAKGFRVFIAEIKNEDLNFDWMALAVRNSNEDSAPIPQVAGATVVSGCTDPEATNYNILATEDDSSCTYPLPVLIPIFDLILVPEVIPELIEPDPILIPIPISPVPDPIPASSDSPSELGDISL